MKLWILHRIPDARCGNSYDAFNGHVIRAHTAERARHLANIRASDEGRIWCDDKKTICVELTADGQEGILLSDFNAA